MEANKREYSIECVKEYYSNYKDISLLKALKEVIDERNIELDDGSLVMLIDNVTQSDNSIDFQKYSLWLNQNGYRSVVTCFESALTVRAYQFLSTVDMDKLDPQIIKNSNPALVFSDAMFVATWFLVRLGFFGSAGLEAQKLINILPTTFKRCEDNALKIISASDFAEQVENIEHIYV